MLTESEAPPTVSQAGPGLVERRSEFRTSRKPCAVCFRLWTWRDCFELLLSFPYKDMLHPGTLSRVNTLSCKLLSLGYLSQTRQEREADGDAH